MNTLKSSMNNLPIPAWGIPFLNRGSFFGFMARCVFLVSFVSSFLLPINAAMANESIVVMRVQGGDLTEAERSTYRAALVEIIKDKYEVITGGAVDQKVLEVFNVVSQEKDDCEKLSCFENIVKAFNAKLLFYSSVTKNKDGYSLSMQIVDMPADKTIMSVSESCENCNEYAVITQLKAMIPFASQETREKLKRAVKLGGKPRILILIDEKIGTTATTTLQAELANHLMQYDFDLVDGAAISPLMKKNDALLNDALAGNTAAAVKLGASNAAEIIIVGVVKTQLGPELYGMQTGQAEASLQAIVSSNGQVIASKNLHGASPHISSMTAQVNAIKKMAQEAVYMDDPIELSFLGQINVFMEKYGKKIK